jgi:hypothetical protein
MFVTPPTNQRANGGLEKSSVEANGASQLMARASALQNASRSRNDF